MLGVLFGQTRLNRKVLFELIWSNRRPNRFSIRLDKAEQIFSSSRQGRTEQICSASQGRLV